MKYLAFALLLVAAPAFAAASLDVGGLVQFIVYLLVIGGIFWLLHWLIGYCNVPEPFNKIARVVLMVVAVLILINILLGFVGYPVFR